MLFAHRRVAPDARAVPSRPRSDGFSHKCVKETDTLFVFPLFIFSHRRIIGAETTLGKCA